MIKARFIKATPTKEGITYILQGERSKDALRAAVDLDNELCTIDIAEPDTAKQETALIMQVFDGMIADVKRWVESAYDIGRAEEQAKWQEVPHD